MDSINDYLETISDEKHKQALREIHQWIQSNFKDLSIRIAWNQPMFTHHDTFIIALSATKKHISIAPEGVAVSAFQEEALKNGYTCSKELIKIPWDKPVNYDFLKALINYNIKEKQDCKTFWRK